jgi:hypothetical protein
VQGSQFVLTADEERIRAEHFGMDKSRLRSIPRRGIRGIFWAR